MEETLGRANVAIRATLEKLDGDLEGAKTKIGSAVAGIAKTAGESLKTLGTAAIAGIGTATAAVVGLGTALAKITIDAAPVEGLASAFEGLAESAGYGMDEMLKALQEGSGGMIANRDLMASFNQAASLVSIDFATQLPNAMQYLGKVSASTGQDMGFLLDSLVKGVGRVSPMILDNLGIQVALEDATARASEMFGVEADQLSKTQIQAGMMDVVLEKLAANTAAMPDVTESASAKLAQMKTKFQNVKDQVGMAFLPILTTVLTVLGNLADRVLPLVDSALAFLGPIIQQVAGAFETFFNAVLGGGPILGALLLALSDLGLPEVAGWIGMVWTAITDLWATISPFVMSIVEWVAQNVSLNDVLMAVGVMIASVVVPAIAGFIAAAAPVVATFVGLIAVIALLRQAWENDWGGIRTALTEFWENSAKPALEALWAWLSVNVPAAIETLKGFWTDTLLPALQTFWTWVQTTVFPLLQTLWDWLETNIPAAIETLKGFWEETLLPALQTFWAWVQETVFPLLQTLWDWLEINIPAAIETLKSFWEETLLPALQSVWAWIDENLIPLFTALGELFDVTLTLAVTAMAGLWEKTLKPALEAVWKYIDENVVPIFEEIGKYLDETLKPIMEDVGTFLTDTWKGAWEGIGTAIQTVIGWIGTLTEALKNVTLPDWMTPGSPTPFEIGLLGIGDAMRELSTMRVPQLAAEFQGLYSTEALPREGADTTSSSPVNIYGDVILPNVQDREGLLDELQGLAV